MRRAGDQLGFGNTCLRVPADALHRVSVGGSGHAILTAGPVSVSALVVLAGCLPGHPKPGGDLRPSNAHADRLIDQRYEFGLRLVPAESGAFDPLQHPSGEDSGEAGGAGPSDSARAWCRRPDCTCLALGWRLDLLT